MVDKLEEQADYAEAARVLFEASRDRFMGVEQCYEAIDALVQAGFIPAATPANGEQVERDTVAFVQYWLMNADYDPTQFDKDFAAAIDARCATSTKSAQVKVLEALDWAVAEIEGRTRYSPDFYTGREQRNNALAKAKEALGDYVPPSLRTTLGNKETDRHG